MPTGVYERTKAIREIKSEGQKAYLNRMTEEERRKRLKLWFDAGKANYVTYQEAGHEANRKKFSKMTKEEKAERFGNWQKAGAIAAQKANPSSIEKKIWKELDKLGIKYETQIPICGGMFIVDIYFLLTKVIVECNGAYWHNYELFPQRKIRDNAIDKWATRNDYKIVWLWESDITKDPKQALIDGFKKLGKER